MLHEEVGGKRPIIVICVMLATIMQALDTTIANVALPYMQGSLSATQDQITWVLTSYIVAAAIMTPPVGWLAGRFGRRNIMLLSIAGFTAASVLCGLAVSLEEIVLFRLLQGVFGAALVPLSQAVMLDLYPPAKQGPAMAMWGMGVMLGPILGPTLGGWLTESYNWRWVFFVNIPIGAVAFLGLLLVLPRDKKGAQLALDWFGFGLISLAIGALQMMLDRGEQLNWFDSGEIVIETVLAAMAFYMFIVHTMTAEKPFIDPKLFADRNLTAGLILMFVVGIVLLATMALVTPYLQNLKGYPVMLTGLILAPRGAGTMLGMMLAGRLVSRMDARLLMLFGFSLTAFSLWEMSGISPDVSNGWLVRTGLTQGLGLGFIFVPLQTLAFATIPPARRTEGAALLSLVRNVGSSIGISVVTFMLIQTTSANHEWIAGMVNPLRAPVAAIPAGSAWDLSTLTGIAALDAEVTRQAAAIAYSDDFLLMMAVALAAIPLLLLLKKPQGAGGGPAHAAAMD